jgi:hypothetical protein
MAPGHCWQSVERRLARKPIFVSQISSTCSAYGDHGALRGYDGPRSFEKIGVADDGAGAAVAQDVAQLRRREMPVQRTIIGSANPGGMDHVGVYGIISEQHCDRITLVKAQSAQAAGKTRSARFQSGCVAKEFPEP